MYVDQRLHGYYRGFLLPQISKHLGVYYINEKKVCGILHKAFKEYAGIETLSVVSEYEFKCYISMIVMLCSREMGFMAWLPGEPKYLNELSMKEWLNLKKEYIDGL